MNQSQKKVAFYTLGCKLNFSETSTIARQFEEMGFQQVSPNSPADVLVINTCSVTEQAEKKCRQAIKKFVARSPNAFVAVVGCYAQLRPHELANIEGVNLILGVDQKGSIPEYLNSKDNKATAKVYSCEVDLVSDFFPAYSSGDRTRSFLKVQDGCDYRCTYCTIPKARGKSRNIPIAKVEEQAHRIAAQGIKEVVLTGVNTGDFGRTTGESFFDLLKTLEKVDGIERYRISSIEPNLITQEIIEFVARSRKFLPHFHIPLQSGSDAILRLMRRRYNTTLFTNKIKAIKDIIPDAFLGIDVIVGFPGESHEHFNETYELLKGLNPSFLHVFPYSVRPDTPAAAFEGKVEPKVIKQRAQKLQELSNRLHHSFYTQNVGRAEQVLFEGTQSRGMMQGFTRNYIRVEMEYQKELVKNIVKVQLTGILENGHMAAKIVDDE